MNRSQRTLLRTAAAGTATLLALATAGACAADDPVAPPASSSSTVAPETNDTEGTTVGTTVGTTRGTTRGTTPGTTGGTSPEQGDEDENASATPTSVNDDHTEWCTDFRDGLTEMGALPEDTEEEAAAAAAEVERIFVSLNDTAPDDIADDFDTVTGSVKARRADKKAPIGDDVKEATGRIEAWSIGNCGFDPDDI